MIDPNADTLRAALCGKLRLIAPLIALLDNDSDNVVEYIEQGRGDLNDAIYKLEPSRILVYHAGMTWADSQPSAWVQRFGIAARVKGSPNAVMSAIMTGVPTGDTLPLFTGNIRTDYNALNLEDWGRRFIPLNEFTFFSYWELLVNFTSRGLLGN